MPEMIRSRSRRARTRSPGNLRFERNAVLAATLTAAALVLGGGGTSNPPTELLLELIFAAGFAVLALLPGGGRRGQRPASAAIFFVILVLALPVLQLVPLPPALWQALPGRANLRDALALVGAQDHWHALTLWPAATLASLLAIAAPLSLLLLVATLDLAGRRLVLGVVALVALVSLPLGALQLAAGESADWSLYAYHHAGFLTGFMANRNATTDVLQISALALLAWAFGSDGERRAPALPVAAAFAVLLVAVPATGSRAGLGLLPVTLLFAWLIARPNLPPALQRPRALVLGAVALAAVAALLLVSGLGVFGKVATRLTHDGDFRPELWRDAWFAARQVFPAGGGLGTIQPLMIAAERLEEVFALNPVSAHDEWLDWLVETGLPGVLLLCLLFGLLGHALWRQREVLRSSRSRGGQREQALFAAGALVIVGLHGFVDYPFAAMALASLAATAAGLLLSPSGGDGAASSTRRS